MAIKDAFTQKPKEPKYFQVMRLDNTEMFIRSTKYDSAKELVEDSENNVIELNQLKTERKRNPMALSKGAIFSAEEVESTVISTFNKLWEIL